VREQFSRTEDRFEREFFGHRWRQASRNTAITQGGYEFKKEGRPAAADNGDCIHVLFC
jgi:hypothetical protein